MFNSEDASENKLCECIKKTGLKHNMACSLQTNCTINKKVVCFKTEFVEIKWKVQIRFGINRNELNESDKI